MVARKAPAHVITVLNLKGGVGKTHTCWLLASVAQERGKRILLVDLDPQANLSSTFLEPVAASESVAAFFDPSAEPDPAALVHRTEFDHIDIIPSTPALASLDESKETEWERTDGHLTLDALVAALRDDYDLIVFDCPPRLSLVSIAALCASDYVIVPSEAIPWGAQGTDLVSRTITYVQEHFNGRLVLLGYVISRLQGSHSYQRTFQLGLQKNHGRAMFDTAIPVRAEYEKSVTDRIPVTLRAPKSLAAQIARDFFDEVFRRIARQSQSARGARKDTRAPAGTAAR